MRFAPNFGDHVPDLSSDLTDDPSATAAASLAAVLWDMDGTLVDTEPYWLAAERDLVEGAGATWNPAILPHMIGQALEHSAVLLQEWFGLTMPALEIVDTLIDSVITRMADEGVPWRPGARELLVGVVDAGVPCALVTMSWQRMVDVVLEQLPAGTFATVVTGDAVTRGKPHPEPYLTAAARLGVDVRRCVAIEDSTPGVASAEAAGARVLAVEAHVPLPPAPGRSRMTTLAGVGVADLARIADGLVVDLVGG
jgi:HAD superfamily hydrolase (TIGR01509 family)